MLLALGGYNSDDQFLDSIEEYDSDGDAWSAAAMATLPNGGKSHFCAVVTSKVRL